MKVKEAMQKAVDWVGPDTPVTEMLGGTGTSPASRGVPKQRRA